MNKSIVITLTEHDRVGIVEEFTDLLVRHGGNVETSRMARLGGEFARSALITFPGQELTAIEKKLQKLRDEGFQITLLQTEDNTAKKYAGWIPYKIEGIGADHEGIIHEIAHHLAMQGINIDDLETSTTPAPMSGNLVFRMNATVLVPPGLGFQKWSRDLDKRSDKLNVNINVAPVK